MTARRRAERRPGQGHAAPPSRPGNRPRTGHTAHTAHAADTAHTTRTRAITLAAGPATVPATATVITTTPPPAILVLVRLARP